jgi:5-methylcytosine-specific restriction endonuclease McrA
MRNTIDDELRVAQAAIRYVFREESMSAIARDFGLTQPTIGGYLRAWGISLRTKQEQRRIDIERGRYDHAHAVRKAWKRGAFATERYRRSRPTGDWGFSRDGENNPFFGRKHSAEVRERLSDHARSRCIPSSGEYGVDWTEELRAAIVTRDLCQCQVCGRGRDRVELQVHHVDCDRANSVPANLLTLCTPCHLAYHGRAELRDEVRAAHAAILERESSAGSEVLAWP